MPLSPKYRYHRLLAPGILSKDNFLFCFVLCFQTRFHCVAKTGLDIVVLSCLPSGFREYKHVMIPRVLFSFYHTDFFRYVTINGIALGDMAILTILIRPINEPPFLSRNRFYLIIYNLCNVLFSLFIEY